ARSDYEMEVEERQRHTAETERVLRRAEEEQRHTAGVFERAAEMIAEVLGRTPSRVPSQRPKEVYKRVGKSDGLQVPFEVTPGMIEVPVLPSMEESQGVYTAPRSMIVEQVQGVPLAESSLHFGYFIHAPQNVQWFRPLAGRYPENAVVPLVEEIPGNVIPSVLSLDFHGALDLHNLKHQNNGAFHYFYKASEQKAYTGYT